MVFAFFVVVSLFMYSVNAFHCPVRELGNVFSDVLLIKKIVSVIIGYI